jgi:hypothetical protein
MRAFGEDGNRPSGGADTGIWVEVNMRDVSGPRTLPPSPQRSKSRMQVCESPETVSPTPRAGVFREGHALMRAAKDHDGSAVALPVRRALQSMTSRACGAAARYARTSSRGRRGSGVACGVEPDSS